MNKLNNYKKLIIRRLSTLITNRFKAALFVNNHAFMVEKFFKNKEQKNPLIGVLF
jgi:hypothetical protein